MNRYLLLLACVACGSAPAAHTIAPARTSGDTTEAHWPSNRPAIVSALKTLHAPITAWRVIHPNECPTIERLRDEHALDPSSRMNDVWGTPYKVTCDDDESHVLSFGPDRREGTPDDITYP